MLELLEAGGLATGRREPLGISRTSLLVFWVRATEGAVEVTVEDGEVVEVTADQFLNNIAPPPMKSSVLLGTSKAADQGGIQSINKVIKQLFGRNKII